MKKNMQMHVLCIEDNVFKFDDISKALSWNMIEDVTHAKDADEGLRMIHESVENAYLYDIVVLDMEFPINGVLHPEAGLKMIDELQKLDYKTNIIICSSVRYAVKEIAGNIFYNKARDLNFDFRDVINRLD